MQSHIRKVYACLAVTCHLHFWQNDQDLLRATVVTQGWNGFWNSVWIHYLVVLTQCKEYPCSLFIVVEWAILFYSQHEGWLKFVCTFFFFFSLQQQSSASVTEVYVRMLKVWWCVYVKVSSQKLVWVHVCVSTCLWVFLKCSKMSEWRFQESVLNLCCCLCVWEEKGVCVFAWVLCVCARVFVWLTVCMCQRSI